MTSEQNVDASPEATPDPAPPEGDAGALRAEAANRRRQLREVEAERDGLRERIDAQDRREVERMARERFTDPRDVWAVTSLDQMRGDDGLVDAVKVEAEFSRIAEDRPHWKRTALPVLDQGVRPSERTPPSFGERLKRAGR